MHGAKDANFWGWGEHAPVKDRKIVNRRLRPHITDQSVAFRAANTWEAEGVVLVRERLEAMARDREGVRVLSGMMAMKGEDYATLPSIRATGGVRPDSHWEANLAAACENAATAREPC